MSRAKRWCFTLNTYTSSDEQRLQTMDCRYLVYGREVAPTTGTAHLQGYVSFDKQLRMQPVKGYVGERAHLEVARGTPQQNRAYCVKGGDFFEKGELPTDGGADEQERWKRAREAAASGKFEEVPDDIYVRHYSNIKRIAMDTMARPAELGELDNVWYYGPPGVGKSWRARHENPNIYSKTCTKWWDGYEPGQAVLLDDVDDGWIRYGTQLKIWADRYPFVAETKGGTARIRPPRVIVTSNYHPASLWSDTMMAQAIERRFTIIQMRDPWNPSVAAVPATEIATATRFI